jgi:hypothetical protein
MWDSMRENSVTQALFESCNNDELARVEESVLANFTALSGGATRPVRFEASCHFAVARRL